MCMIVARAAGSVGAQAFSWVSARGSISMVVQVFDDACAALQVLLNSMLKEERAGQSAAPDLSANGHASASEEENRPKPCVPKAEQIRAHSAAPHSTDPVVGLPQEKPDQKPLDGHLGMAASGSNRRKAFKMEWDFSQHIQYPVMRLKQSSRPQ